MDENGEAYEHMAHGKEYQFKQLITLCLSNDRLAQSKLYQLSFDFMYRIAIRYERNHDEAIHIMNEAFYKILLNIHQYNMDAPFLPWAKTILIHCIINKFKKANRIKTGKNVQMVNIDDEAMSLSVTPEIEAQIESGYLLGLLQSLPECTRKVFNFYVVEGYSHKEIAKILGIHEGTSKWHLATGRKKIIEALKDKTNGTGL